MTSSSFGCSDQKYRNKAIILGVLQSIFFTREVSMFMLTYLMLGRTDLFTRITCHAFAASVDILRGDTNDNDIVILFDWQSSVSPLIRKSSDLPFQWQSSVSPLQHIIYFREKLHR